MSGIEVAGLVLGVLPILFAAVDFSKDGVHRFGIAFQKRKHVEKLARALLLQQQTLEETVRSVIIASGSKDVSRLDDEPLGYLTDESVREEVLDYLGPRNDAAFTGALTQSNDIVKKIAKNIAGLVPTFKDPSDDLLRIIDANRDATGRRLDLIPRVKLTFGIKDLKEAVQELDDTTGALDRFTRILLSNRQTSDGKSSNKAVKLAKALGQVRKFASHLSLAIFHGSRAGCHSKHEARLFLDDRVDSAPEILKRIGKENSVPILVFQLIFAANNGQGVTLWHETAVQVFNDDSEDDRKPSITNRDSGASQVTFVTSVTGAQIKPKVTSVESICGAIEEATFCKRQISFVLVGNQQIGTVTTDEAMLIPCQQVDTISLKALFLGDRSHRRGPILPWKYRMLLALRLASNLLQLIQTRWLERAWSKDTVYFMLRATGSADSAAQGHLQADLSRPFVSLTFDDTKVNTQPQPKIEPKVALLELGILLLEVWHETTLETRFSLEEAPTGYYQRLARAAEWLDDTENPLPDLYDKAVSRCIHGTVGENRLPDWEDTKFLGAICGDVIEPLSKNCKQWR